MLNMETAGFAVVGATGLVGQEMLKILGEQGTPPQNVRALARAASAGKTVAYGDTELTVEDVATANLAGVQIALMAVESGISCVLSPQLAAQGIVVIDNSSEWRLHRDVPLVVPEVNPQDISRWKRRGIIANPNCSTIQMLVALAPLHRAFKAFRIAASTYQSVSGAGRDGQEELTAQINGSLEVKTFAAPIHRNVVPLVGTITKNGYSDEELKMLNESRKILNAQALKVSATCVRVPVMVGHMVDVKVAFRRPFQMDEVFDLLRTAPGVRLVDNISELTPRELENGSDDVLVGRVRRDEVIDDDNGLTFVCVANNVRKGAALNAVQIAEAWLAMQRKAEAA